MVTSPIVSWLNRRWRIASSSSRKALGAQLGRRGGRGIGRGVHRQRGGPLLGVEREGHVAVAQGAAVVVDVGGERGQLDAPLGAGGVGGRQLGGVGGDAVVPLGAGKGAVDDLVAHRVAGAEALGLGAEEVRDVPAHKALVDQPGEATRARQHAQQRDLGEAHRSRAIVDQPDLVAGQGELVATARGRAVERRDPAQARLVARLFEADPGLVGILAEVYLEAVGRAGQHSDVRAGTEDPRQVGGQHHDPDLGVLEAQALDRVVQLEVDAQIVAVELEQVVVGAEAVLLVDAQGEPRDRAVDREAPVQVAARVTREGRNMLDLDVGTHGGNLHDGAGRGCSAAAQARHPRCDGPCYLPSMDPWSTSEIAAVAAVVLAAVHLYASPWRDVAVTTLGAIGGALAFARGFPTPTAAALLAVAVLVTAAAWGRGARHGVGRPGLAGVGLVAVALGLLAPFALPEHIPPEPRERVVQAAIVAIGLCTSVGFSIALERPGPRRARPALLRRVAIGPEPRPAEPSGGPTSAPPRAASDSP